jgi:hypothetical protein
MSYDNHVCKKCGYDDREAAEDAPKNKAELDWGDNASTRTANAAAGMFAALIGGPGDLPKVLEDSRPDPDLNPHKALGELAGEPENIVDAVQEVIAEPEDDPNNPIVGLTQDPESGDLIMHIDPTKIPAPPDPIPVERILDIPYGETSLVDLVLKGVAKGYPRCCVEFMARCHVGGLDPYKHGGVNVEPEWDRMRCPLCNMGTDDIETEIADREEIINATPIGEETPEEIEAELTELRRRLVIRNAEEEGTL